MSAQHICISLRQSHIRTALWGQTKGQSNPVSCLRQWPVADAQSKGQRKQDQCPEAFTGVPVVLPVLSGHRASWAGAAAGPLHLTVTNGLVLSEFV